MTTSMITTDSASRPRSRVNPERLSLNNAKRMAKEAGARDVELIVSYLVHATSVADGEQLLIVLRRNRPECFGRVRRPR